MNGAVTVTSTAVVTGAATVAGAFRAGAAATIIGAANLSSTFGVVGAASLNSSLVVTGPATVGGKVTLAQSAVLVTGGTTFPGSPASDDQFFRTDLDMWFRYDGTRWVSVQLFTHQVPWVSEAQTQPISATGANELQSGTPDLQGGSDIWLVASCLKFFVNGGTALSGSHKWVVDLQKFSVAASQTTIVTHNVDSGASDVPREDRQLIGALLNNGTLHHAFFVDATKTGTPGTLSHYLQVSYRIVAT